MTGVLIIRRGEDTQTHTQRDGQVKMESENGVMLPKAKACLGLP